MWEKYIGKKMMPIGPLMIEHRLIERMVNVLKKELAKIEKTKKIDPSFIDTAVDFFRTYADRCHHGKEEDILFHELAQKNLSSEHNKTMDELIEEHIFGRSMVSNLLESKERYIKSEKGAVMEVLDGLHTLVEFYPKHIEKEDKHFFIPCMYYFSQDEKDEMLKKSWEFDMKMIHEKYRNVVEQYEKKMKNI